MIGPIINAVLIICGSLLGKIIGNKINKNLEKEIMNIIALVILFIGIKLGLMSNNPTLMIISGVVGITIGYKLDLDNKLNNFGDYFKNLILKNSKDKKFGEAMIFATILFCVGSMGIIGAIQEGINNDPSILISKSIIDSIASIILTTSMGIGVAFSSIFVLIYEGLIVLIASSVQHLFTQELLKEISGIGGILIFAISLNMLKLTNIKISNTIPSIFIPVVYYLILNLIK